MATKASTKKSSSKTSAADHPKALIIAEKPSVANDIAKALGGFTKYEDYLKTLMEKYNDLKNERDNIKHKLLNMNETNTNTNKYSSDAMEEKKKELIQLSTKVQEQIRRLEELQERQESSQNNQEE